MCFKHATLWPCVPFVTSLKWRETTHTVAGDKGNRAPQSSHNDIEIFHKPPSVEVSTVFRLLVISQCHFSRKFAANEVGSPSVAACCCHLLPSTILHHISRVCEDCKQDLPHLWPREGLLEASHLNLWLDYVAHLQLVELLPYTL